MTALAFGELPPSMSPRDRPSRWAEDVAQLKANPLQWARIATAESASRANSIAVNFRNSRVRGTEPKGSFQAALRGCDVWVRYVGEVAS